MSRGWITSGRYRAALDRQKRYRRPGPRRRLAQATLDCYVGWIRRFLAFHRTPQGWRHPRELRAAEVAAYLDYLARRRPVSASTQNHPFNATVFLYHQVLGDEIGEDHLGRFAALRAKRPVRVPTVLSISEVRG